LTLIISTLLKKINNRKELQDVIANTSWLFADRVLRMGVGLLVGVWVARHLGVVQFGVFNYANAFVALFITVSNLGLPSLVVRTITHEPGNIPHILGTTFLLQLGGGIASFLLSTIAISILRHDDPLMISLVAIFASAGIFQAFDTIDLRFQAQVQSKYTVIAKNIAFSVVAMLKIVLINLHAPLLAFAVAQLVEVAIGAVGLIVIYKIQGYSLWVWRWSWTLAKTLLKESWSLILSGLAIIIYMKVDQIMLGEMVGNQAVGLYSSSARISEIWYFIPTAITSSLAPAIYSAKKEGNDFLYYRRIRQLLRLLSCISIVIAVPISLLSETIVTLLFGNEYAGAAPILSIHIWAALFAFSGVGASLWFVAEELTYIAFRRTLIGAIVNVLLNILLIPTYSGVGAAVATLISYATGGILANAATPKTWKIFAIQIRAMLFV
jgi:polysaccharide transporter, PST family